MRKLLIALTLIMLIVPGLAIALGDYTETRYSELFNAPGGELDGLEAAGGDLMLQRLPAFVNISSTGASGLAASGGAVYLATAAGLMRYDGSSTTTARAGNCKAVAVHSGVVFGGFLDGSVYAITGSTPMQVKPAGQIPVTGLWDVGAYLVIACEDRLYKYTETGGLEYKEDGDASGEINWLGVYPYKRGDDTFWASESVHNYIEEHGNINEDRARIMMLEWYTQVALVLISHLVLPVWMYQWAQFLAYAQITEWFTDYRLVERDDYALKEFVGAAQVGNDRYLMSNQALFKWSSDSGRWWPIKVNMKAEYTCLGSDGEELVVGYTEGSNKFIANMDTDGIEGTEVSLNAAPTAISHDGELYLIGLSDSTVMAMQSIYLPVKGANIGDSLGAVSGISNVGGVHYVATASWFGSFNVDNYVHYGFYMSEDDVQTMAIYAASVSWTRTIADDTSIIVSISNDGGEAWEDISDSLGRRFEFTNVDASNEDERRSWRYMVEMYGPGLVTPTMLSINWTLYTADTPEVEDVHLGVNPLNPDGIYYTLERVPMFATIADGDYIGAYNVFWDFGDPNANTTNPPTYNQTVEGYQGANASHMYAKAGDYTITVNVTDATGRTSEQEFVITIYNRRPYVSVTPAVLRGHPGDTLSMSMDAWDDDGYILAYNWRMGGDTGVTRQLSMVFPDEFRGYAYAVVRDDDGDWSPEVIRDEAGRLCAVDIDVSADTLPSAYFTYSPASPVMGDTVQFTFAGGDLEGPISAYNWTMDDASFSQVPSPSLQFSEPGAYTVALTVTDSAGQNSTFSSPVFVSPCPEYGDWIVTEDTLLDGWELTRRGKIVIENGATLTLRNCSVIFDCRSHGQYGVEVNNGALDLYRSVLGPSYTVDSEEGVLRVHYWYMDVVDAELRAANSYIEALYTGRSDGLDGVTLQSTASASLNDSSIVGSQGHAVSMRSLIIMPDLSMRSCELAYAGGIYGEGDVELSDVSIHDSAEAIHARKGAWSAEGLTIARMQQQAVFTLSDARLTIDSANIKQCGEASLELEGAASLDNMSVVGTGSGHTLMHVADGISATCNNSELACGDYGIVAQDGALVDCYSCRVDEVKNEAWDYYAPGTGRIRLFGHIAASVTDDGRPASASAQWMTDGALVHEDNFTGVSDAFPMIYMTASAGAKSYNNNTLSVVCVAGSEARRVNASLAHTELFAFGEEQDDIIPPNPPDDEEGLAWWWSVLAVVVLWAALLGLWYAGILDLDLEYVLIVGDVLGLLLVFLITPAYLLYATALTLLSFVGLIWAFDMFDDDARIWVSIACAVIGLAAAAWEFFGLSIGGLDAYMPYIATGIAVVVGLVLYFSFGFGKGKDAYWLGGTAVVAVIVFLLTWGNTLYIFIGAMVALIALVVWYVIGTDAKISFGAAGLILAVLAVLGIGLAFMMGLLDPVGWASNLWGNAVGGATDAIEDKLIPDWWPF